MIEVGEAGLAAVDDGGRAGGRGHRKGLVRDGGGGLSGRRRRGDSIIVARGAPITMLLGLLLRVISRNFVKILQFFVLILSQMKQKPSNEFLNFLKLQNVAVLL